MRPKSGQPTSIQGQVGPKPQLGPPEPFLAPNPMKTLRTHFGQGSPWNTFQPMASGNHQRPPDQLSNPSPQLKGDFPILHASRTQGCRSAAYMVPKSNAHFEGDLFSSSVWQSMAAIRRPFKDPNHLALQELGWQLSQDYLKGPSQRLFIIQSVVKAESTSILLGQLNWSIQAEINYTCMSLTQSGQFKFHCGNSITEFNSQDVQNCIGPIQTIQLVTHLPASAPQLFTYTGHLSSPGDFFPS
ncbi:hypothetical protein O181_126445 [Austropuccinia psidii MF-1]|uniref:Uncharacterized protein n=1 Tax=Austropuccinia psidii MF-1 TaxID=1389203 RepID=A0A9Q3Q726_9BASI|nr:hypothetical protein [Austropuccinia psidii MF-1]